MDQKLWHYWWLKISFSWLKMHHFRGKIPKQVLTPQKKTSCHTFKMTIFSKFFVDVMTHIIRENAGKRMKYFLNFSLIKIVNLLWSLFQVPTLYILPWIGKVYQSLGFGKFYYSHFILKVMTILNHLEKMFCLFTYYTFNKCRLKYKCLGV